MSKTLHWERVIPSKDTKVEHPEVVAAKVNGGYLFAAIRWEGANGPEGSWSLVFVPSTENNHGRGPQ